MEISNLDHLGLVAGVIDEIGIEEIINRRLGEHWRKSALVKS